VISKIWYQVILSASLQVVHYVAAKLPDHEEQFVELTRDSQVNLEAALAWFEQVTDSVNLAFVLANCGRLERLRASIRVPLGPQERENYAKVMFNIFLDILQHLYNSMT
jgi:hypothetical protein